MDLKEIKGSLDFALSQRNPVVQELCAHLKSCIEEIETLRLLAKENVSVTLLQVNSGEVIALALPENVAVSDMDHSLDVIRRFVSSKGVMDTLIVGLFGGATIQHLDKKTMRELGWVKRNGV